MLQENAISEIVKGFYQISVNIEQRPNIYFIMSKKKLLTKVDQTQMPE